MPHYLHYWKREKVRLAFEGHDGPLLRVASRKLTRQGYSGKLDYHATCDLGKKVRGGTRPRLRWGRTVL